MTPDSRPRRALARLLWPLRRVAAPAALEIAALEIPDQVSQVSREVQRLRDEVDGLRAQVAELRSRDDDVDRQLATILDHGRDQAARLQELHEGLQEARRLNIRIAELTDIVTELVLPLHGREIEADALTRLRPDAV